MDNKHKILHKNYLLAEYHRYLTDPEYVETIKDLFNIDIDLDYTKHRIKELEEEIKELEKGVIIANAQEEEK